MQTRFESSTSFDRRSNPTVAAGSLKLFDARRMPGYGAFRDQIAEFLESYDAFQLGYHVTQVTVDGEFRRYAGGGCGWKRRPAMGPLQRFGGKFPARLVVTWDGQIVEDCGLRAAESVSVN